MKQLDVNRVITAARKNDQKAFSMLFELYWDRVYRMQLQITQNENLAEEQAVLTFTRAFDRIDQYDDSYAFSTWLLTIGRNLSIDALRKRKRDQEQWNTGTAKEEEISDALPSPEELLIASQSLDQLLEGIQNLKKEYRQLLQLRFFEGYTYKELSDHFQQPMNTIKVKLMRAKKILSEQLPKT